MYLLYILLLLIIPIYYSYKVNKTYKKYQDFETISGLSGYEAARKVLNENNLHHVKIELSSGFLSDHYDPRSKTVRLSESNYKGKNISAISVAIHEVGHAIQDSESYFFLTFRSLLFPLARLGSNLSFFIILAGALLSSTNLLTIGVFFMAFAVLFQIVTLPVEFNASNRALDLMQANSILFKEEEQYAKKVLNAAALTYVASTVVAVAELVRFLAIIFVGED